MNKQSLVKALEHAAIAAVSVFVVQALNYLIANPVDIHYKTVVIPSLFVVTALKYVRDIIKHRNET
jgi:hypothetical protein